MPKATHREMNDWRDPAAGRPTGPVTGLPHPGVTAVDAGLIDFAHRLADRSGEVIGPYFRQPIAVDVKADDSPVTAADRAAEAAIREMIGRFAPDHGIIGEEFGSEGADRDWVWVLDPIDGTKAFLTGRPTFGTLIALCHRGWPVLGVIDQPVSGERWIGAAGRPSLFNGAEIRTRACTELGKAWLMATHPDMFEGRDEERFLRLSRSVQAVQYGCDCYAYGLLASGFLDIVCEAQLQIYDYAALAPIIAGAGGLISDWSGAPLNLGSNGRVLALGDPSLLDDVLSRLAYRD